MPKFDPSAPTADVEFVGVKLKAPLAFADGATLTPLETKFLNRALISTVGNQYAGDVRRAVAALTEDRIKAAVTAPKAQEAALATFTKTGTVPPSVTKATTSDLDWDHQAKFLDKFTNYTLGVNNRSGDGPSTSDPVAAFTRTLAVAEVNKLIAANNLKVAAFQAHKEADGRSRYVHLIEDYIAQNPHLADIAKAQVAAMQAAKEEAAASATGSLDLSLPATTDTPALEGAPA